MQALPKSELTKKQTKTYGPRFYTEDGAEHKIVATVRYDDRCGNGHNTFSITGETWRSGRERTGGCIHEEIAKHFPELAPFIKWHLVSSDGPMHYIANTTYHASNRDYNGLLKGERRQIRNGRTGKPSWKLEASEKLPQYVDSDTQPTETATLHYVPWETIGEGKERELDAARSCAVWPEATDEELTGDNLPELLKARLPGLMAAFKVDVEKLGLTY